MSRILVTGGAGLVGSYLRHGLPALGWQLRTLDLVDVSDPVEGEEVVRADIHDGDALARAMRDVAAVVHLAGIPTEAAFADICAANIDGTYRVFEAARAAGVRRIVYASSNHAVGFTPRQELAGVDVPPRPDTFYGVSKAFGEALARYYVDRHGMQVVCLRIGSCCPVPTSVRMLSTWLSPGDMARLAHACLSTPDLDFAVVYGISANTRGWWDLAPGRALGYEPVDDAEKYATQVLAECGEPDPTDPDHAFLGGHYTAITPPA